MIAKQFPPCALLLHFLAQTLPNNINQLRLVIFTGEFLNNILTKNSWIKFG
jgi:hypothetical protein